MDAPRGDKWSLQAGIETRCSAIWPLGTENPSPLSAQASSETSSAGITQKKPKSSHFLSYKPIGFSLGGQEQNAASSPALPFVKDPRVGNRKLENKTAFTINPNLKEHCWVRRGG